VNRAEDEGDEESDAQRRDAPQPGKDFHAATLQRHAGRVAFLADLRVERVMNAWAPNQAVVVKLGRRSSRSSCWDRRLTSLLLMM
jgi:hypothetical protein